MFAPVSLNPSVLWILEPHVDYYVVVLWNHQGRLWAVPCAPKKGRCQMNTARGCTGAGAGVTGYRWIPGGWISPDRSVPPGQTFINPLSLHIKPKIQFLIKVGCYWRSSTKHTWISSAICMCVQYVQCICVYICDMQVTSWQYDSNLNKISDRPQIYSIACIQISLNVRLVDRTSRSPWPGTSNGIWSGWNWL